MKKQKLIALFSITALLITMSLASVPVVSAEGVQTLGEIRTSGKVFIQSSNREWIPAGSSYPLLQNTAVKTEDGSAAFIFTDGARVDISENTIVMVDGSPSDYSVSLAKGILAFNIGPATTFTAITPSTNITVNKSGSLVQKVGYENKGRTLGAVQVTEKGTEVRNISGNMTVSIGASTTRLVSAGQAIFIGNDNAFRVLKTQGVGGGVTGSTTGDALLFFGTSGALAGAAALLQDDDGDGRPASPFVP